METRLPWRPTRGSLTSPSYLVDSTVPVSVSIEAAPLFADADLVVVPGANHGFSQALYKAFEENVFRFLTEKMSK